MIPKKITLCKEKVVEDTLKIEQGARLSKAFGALKLSQIAVSQLTGLSQPLLSQVCTGRRGITRRVEFAIAEKLPQVNMRWVLTGKGDMFLVEEKPQDKVEESSSAYQTDPLSALRRMMDEHLEMMQLLAEHRAEIEALKERVGALEKKLNSKL